MPQAALGDIHCHGNYNDCHKPCLAGGHMHPSEPSTIDQPTVSPQTAGTLQSDQATVRRPAPVFRIGRAGSSTLDPVRDIHKLLRARLRVVSLLAAVALTQYLVTGLLTPPSVLSAGLDATLEAL